MQTNLDAAQALARQGMSIFPVQGGMGPDAKHPHRAIGSWKTSATTSENDLHTWFSTFPTAAPGVACLPSGLVVIDADRHEGGADGVAAWEALIAAHGGFDAPIVRTAGGGRHTYFKLPPGMEPSDSRGALPDGIDVKSKGYVVGAGASFGPDRVYTLISGDLGSIPILPPFLRALIEGRRVADVAAPQMASMAPLALPALVSMPPSTGRVQAYAASALANLVAEVRGAVQGERSNVLNSSAFSIGTMCGAGWLSEAEAEAQLVSAVDGWDNPSKTLSTLKRALRDGMAHPRPALPDDLVVDHAAMVAPLLATHDAKAADTRLVEQADGAIIDSETGEVVSAHGEAEASGFPPTLYPGFSVLAPELRGVPRGVMLGFPPGVVGSLAQWIVDTSRRPQPMLALGAALAIVGTAAGQLVLGPTGSGLHLYVLGLGRTAVGKDRPLKVCVSALSDAGLDRLVGGSDFISMPALINSTVSRPVSLWAMDELGAMLTRINNKKASGWEASISPMLRKMWSAGYEKIMTPEWASREREAIFAPCLSIFGVSTSEEFLESVSVGDLRNGLLNRMLILPEAHYVPVREPAIVDLRLPEKLVTALRELRGGDPASPLVDVAAPATPTGKPPLRLGWDCADRLDGVAERAWLGLEARLDALAASEDGKRGGEEIAFFARTPEMALRIASIIAVGRGSTSVNVADLIWGTELASQSARAFMGAFRSHVTGSEHSARVEFVERVMKRERTISRQRLMKLASKRMDARQLNSVIDQMIEAGQVEKTVITASGAAHRRGVGYRWIGD